MGDNLGSNHICGFIKSFKSNYFRRICKVTLKEASEVAYEITEKFRNRENYIKDVSMHDESKTGIKEMCAFNDVHGFFITENKCLDFMHDVLEGVCNYVLKRLLNTLIYEKSYFTLEWLNSRIKEFIYGDTESNTPPTITYNRMKSKLSLKMSASEMLCFTKYLGLIIGDKVPRDDEHWVLYKLLATIVNILMSPTVDVGLLRDFRDLVEDFCSLYIKFYGNFLSSTIQNSTICYIMLD